MERQHITDVAWERIKQADWPRWIFDGLEGAHKRAGVMLVTVEEWDERENALAAIRKDYRANVDDLVRAETELAALRAELGRLRVPNSGTNAPKSRTGALLLQTREIGARLGFGDAGEER